ncbi:MAG: iron-containing alcohol dehydrogenase [Alphaproteobacteria bacterium]|nr:iron-containing alcohol dehydrogenase [Alphaproteobacteria bacterium]MDX5369177.1 iron-containing alcohol dehydrogenase [Alphaproteobacteria bacterium]MDX5463873.1 iron-containing alcohol dehydrogenase [Alphaproteobacteria bacterium]
MDIRHVTLQSPTDIGAGAVDALPRVAAAAGFTRPLMIVCGATTTFGLLHRMRAMPAPPGRAVPFEVRRTVAHEDTIAEALSLFNDMSCDSVIAAGSGAALDTARAVAMLAGTTAPLAAVAERPALVRTAKPWIAIVPAPACMTPLSDRIVADVRGEVGHAPQRLAIDATRARPAHILCDTECMLALSPPALAAGLFAALMQAAETLAEPDAPHANRALAAQAVRMIAGPGGLLGNAGALTEPELAPSRIALFEAAGMAALARSGRPIGAASALTLALTGLQGVRHGPIAAALLPAWLETHARADALDAALSPLVDKGRAASVAQALTARRDAAGLAPTVRELGIESAAGADARADALAGEDAAGDIAVLMRRAGLTETGT